MTKNKCMKWFIVEIEIIQTCWDYIQGQKILIPLQSNNYNNATQKFEGLMNGSEFPSYKINHIHECDSFLFNPNRFK